MERQPGRRHGPTSRVRKIVLFLNAVYELVLQMTIARCFALGHKTPGQRQILVHVGAV